LLYYINRKTDQVIKKHYVFKVAIGCSVSLLSSLSVSNCQFNDLLMLNEAIILVDPYLTNRYVVQRHCVALLLLINSVCRCVIE